MKSLATLRMLTKLGHTSTWHFVKCGDGYWAFGSCTHGRKPAPPKYFTTVKDLRAMYQSMLKYGYGPIIDDESELPVQLQLELGALAA